MTPFNYELFEFNKMILVYLLTTIIMAAWLIKMVIAKKFIFRRTFMDIPLIIFLISQTLSFYFSIDQHTSLWGYYSRFNGGLLSIIAYLLLYWAFVSNMARRDTQNVIRWVLTSATLVSIYGIAEHFGIDAKYWVQDVQNRVFSTLGQPNWLAAYLVALIPLTWAFALNSKFKTQNAKSQNKIQKFLDFKMYFLFLIFYICLLFTRSRSGLLGFAAAYLAFWSLIFWLQRRQWKQILKPFLLFTSLVSLITLLIGTPWGKSNKTAELQSNRATEQPVLISESGDIRKIVWKGAVEIWRHYPIFGTGPETFAYSYYWFRPREHNDVSEWDFLYNKAHNEYLNLAATTGTVGLVSYLLLIIWYLVSSIKYQGILNTAFLAGYASILVTNFFGFSVVPVSLLFFLLPAISVVSNSPQKENKISLEKLKVWQLAVVVLILYSAFYLLYSVSSYWYADTQFASAEKLSKAGQYDFAFNNLQLAVKSKPQEPIYHDALAGATGNLAVLADEQENATLSGQLVEIAISESDTALKISPYHLNFWKNRVKLLYQLAKIDPQCYQEILPSLLQASQLAPTDAKIKYNLALIYASENQINLTVETLEESVQLKPNYEDARYALALFYEQQGRKDDAQKQLEYILENINPQSEKAKEKLETL